jgi:hypothetical protein
MCSVCPIPAYAHIAAVSNVTAPGAKAAPLTAVQAAGDAKTGSCTAGAKQRGGSVPAHAGASDAHAAATARKNNDDRRDKLERLPRQPAP